MDRVKKDALVPGGEQGFLSFQMLPLRLEQRREGCMTDNRLKSQLRERVKELDCLDSLTKLGEQSENSVVKILQGG